ncbi:MAG: hypothetical protein MJ230_07025, partial [bacterium]|nr:hypothetical protein [bacterium]
KTFGIDLINETPFEKLVNIGQAEYLKMIVEKYSPIAIFTGYNYTFGKNREGNADTLKTFSSKYNYKYFDIAPIKDNNDVVSSTFIKKLLKQADLIRANNLLCDNFFIEGIVIEGQKLGRKLGFPTANINYPPEIIKLPYGVYKAEVMDMPAVLNWGVKPTVNGIKPIVEVYIPNFNGDLYGKKLRVKFIKKIRDEIKFSSIEELKIQIKKDINKCLK